jgi:hypothetical protein
MESLVIADDFREREAASKKPKTMREKELSADSQTGLGFTFI